MNAPYMKGSVALVLQVIVVLIGIGALGWMLWEPHLEGRNAHASTFEIYCHDPFLAYVYAGSVPFFVALYQAFGLFGQVRRNGAFSQASLTSLRVIRRCGLAILGFVAGGVVFILAFGDREDRPAGVFMCGLVAVVATVIATAAAMAARNLQSALSRADVDQA